MIAKKISLQNAKGNKLFYVVANAVVWRVVDQRCLILRRDKREKVHPGKWGVIGGKLEWENLDIHHPTRLNGDVLDFEDVVEDLLEREAREEAGIAIDRDLLYINSVAFVRPDGVPIVMVKFAAEYRSGDVKPEVGGFTDYAWVNAQEVHDYECILGIPEEVERAIQLFQASSMVSPAHPQP